MEVRMNTCENIAKMIDHSLLRPFLTQEEITEGLETAKRYHCATVCVHPEDVARAASFLKGSDVKVSTVIGFPHGAHTTDVKVYEAKRALEDGAVELDMVLNIGRLLSGEYDYVRQEIRQIVELAHASGAIVKVILENCYLSRELIRIGCEISEQAGADFVKTSTGFGTGGATLEDLRLMRDSCSPAVKIKAAGGVRTLDDVLKVIEAGTDRFGATATVSILEECKRRNSE